MKSLFLLVAITLFTLTNAQSQSKTVTETLKVYGKCGMCKTKIEKTLSYTSGVKYGEWDVETKMLTVKYNSTKVTLEEIKQALADIGYDSETHRATQKSYDNLHGCCKYERPE